MIQQKVYLARGWLKNSLVLFERPRSFLFFVDWQPDTTANVKLITAINKIYRAILFMVFV